MELKYKNIWNYLFGPIFKEPTTKTESIVHCHTKFRAIIWNWHEDKFGLNVKKLEHRRFKKNGSPILSKYSWF